MIRVWAYSLGFLLANGAVLWAILRLNRRPRARRPTDPRPLASAEQRPLPASEILAWEFDYARTTASESMEQRHTMINFYLLVAGILTSGTVALLAGDVDLPPAVGALLLWLLCGIGWIYFLSLVRLRQAWHDSAQVMNEVKEFYVRHVQDLDPGELDGAFRWKKGSLPPAGQPWTIFFYSAALIGLLDSVAFVGGGALLDLQAVMARPWPALGSLALLGALLFAWHMWLYFAFLRT